MENMGKLPLLDVSSDSDVELKINEEYAERYDKWRAKEEMQKLKAKYGDVSTSSSSSDSEDDGSPLVDKSFYKALSLVKSRDSKIYEASDTLLPESEVQTKKAKEKKPKPMFLKDYERQRVFVFERDGKLSDSEEELPQKKLHFNEEQELIKKSFMDFDVSEDDDDSSEILKVRKATKEEQQKLEDDYVAYLKGQKTVPKENEDEKKELTFLQSYWNDPKLSENEQFLRDYFLNAGYQEDDKSEEIPTYEDITNDVAAESDKEEKEEVAAAEFEQKYNFRYEEPDSEFIKRYPRTIKDSLRRQDQKRKIKRVEYAERKQLEKEQRREEIKRLKALKRKEIEEKLSLLRETLDDEHIALEGIDIEGDFDPAEHDRKMKELFSDQYYEAPEEEKPSFPEDEDLDFEGWDNWTGDDNVEQSNSADYDGPHCEDPDFNMDADYEDPKLVFQREMIGASKQGSKKKKKSRFAVAVGKKKPLFDPSDKSFEQYFDEYYRLDCEDFIGDLSTRFKYREVVSNDFGLSIDEVLAADDKELNRWCSLKKICQHREKQEELYDVQAYQKKAQNEHKKKKIFSTLYNETSAENADSTEQKTKKEKQIESLGNEDILNMPETCGAETSSFSVQNGAEDQTSGPSVDQRVKKKKRKKNKDATLNEGTVDTVPNQTSNDAEIFASVMHNDTVISPSSENRKRKHVEDASNASEENTSFSSAVQGKKKKKKKKKKKHSTGGTGKFHAHDTRDGATNNFGKSPHQKKRGKHMSTEETDKRLLLSNKRLEAYGINPKKFKGKIIFSNK